MAIKNLTITVIDGGKGNFKTNRQPSGNEEENGGAENKFRNVLNIGGNIKKEMKNNMNATSYFALQLGTQIATNTVRQTINYYVSDIGRSNGDSNYQALVNRKIEQVSDVMSVGGGILSGAKIGSMFGPWGAGIGAVAGAITSGISIGFRQMERERAYQHEMFKQNTSQAYNLARANYSVWTGRVR